MRFSVGDGVEGQQAGKDEGQAQEKKSLGAGKGGGRPDGARWGGEDVGEGETAAVDGGRESVAVKGEEGRHSRRETKGNREGDGSKQQREEEEQEEPERVERGGDDGRPKRIRAKGGTYGEEGSEEA